MKDMGKINLKKYILFTMYSAPLVDIVNYIFRNVISAGQIIRALIIALNLSFILLSSSKGVSKEKRTIIFTTLFLLLHILFGIIIYTFGSVGTNAAYAMKVLLYLSEMVLVMVGATREKLCLGDYEKFWTFSIFFIPIAIICAKIMDINPRVEGGFYHSANAMSFILIAQVLISALYANKTVKYWIGMILNLTGLVLLGRKSPYFLLAFAFIYILFFNSKHRIRFLVVSVIGLVTAYFVIQRYFQSQWNAFFAHQRYAFTQASVSGDYITYFLSGRNSLFDAILSKMNSWLKWLTVFAVGLTPYGLFSSVGEYLHLGEMRGIEMDPIELLFSYGIILVIVVYKYFIKSVRLRIKNRKLALYLNLAIICTAIYSFLGGHVITEGISATYCAILISYKYIALKNENIMALRNKKVFQA